MESTGHQWISAKMTRYTESFLLLLEHAVEQAVELTMIDVVLISLQLFLNIRWLVHNIW